MPLICLELAGRRLQPDLRRHRRVALLQRDRRVLEDKQQRLLTVRSPQQGSSLVFCTCSVACRLLITSAWRHSPLELWISCEPRLTPAFFRCLQ